MFRLLVAVLIIMFLGLQYRLWLGEPSLPEIWQLNAQIKQQEKNNETLNQRNAELKAEVKDLKQGQSAMEERARSELGMIKKGETFYQLIESETEK